MFKNYLKIAWRNLWKNKTYSAINIGGLAIGITCASLILLWIEDEVNYDSDFPKQDLVYLVPTNQKYEGEWRTFYSTPGPLAKDLKNEIPEIMKSTTTWKGEILIADADKGINRWGRYVEPDFLDIFSLRFLEGDPQNALDRPDAIVLTRKTANALFGRDADALDRVLKINNAYSFTVTGVVEDLQNNVTFGFDWLLPFERFQLGEGDMSWTKEYGNNFADTFVELAPDADFKAVDAKVRKMLPAKTEDPNTYAFLHSMKDWHLRSEFKGGKIVGGQIIYVRLFSIIAIIVLLIACINFMNLSTARSEKRAKEVGIRKVLGSNKNKLVSQFMVEALLMGGMAAIVSVVLLMLLLPQFNTLVEKQLDLALFKPLHLFSLMGITLICGLLAGWYPAFYLSSFRPVKIIKGIQARGNSAAYIRKGLVVAQFAVSIVFIISTIIVYQQVAHVKNRDLGYKKENLVKINVSGDMIKNFDPIRQDMIASGLIENLGLNNSEILHGGNNGSGFEWQGGTDTEDVLISFRHISPSFLETAGMKIVEGRGFSANRESDSTSVMISQTLANLMGDGSAVGKTITRGATYTIIGVVQDYLYGDMYGTSDPVLFLNNPDAANYLYIKIKTGHSISEALGVMENVMKRHNPAFPFDYEFVDDAFNAMFRSEKMVGSLSLIFASLAIIISCLGLFGLAAYTSEQRRKEIGVRKVLGSSVTGIVRLLSKDFMGLVWVAILIAIPFAWWAMQNWLETFAYRIAINWWVFLIAGLIAIAIALITVSFQAIRAATVNPVKSLRTE